MGGTRTVPPFLCSN